MHLSYYWFKNRLAIYVVPSQNLNQCQFRFVVLTFLKPVSCQTFVHATIVQMYYPVQRGAIDFLIMDYSNTNFSSNGNRDRNTFTVAQLPFFIPKQLNPISYMAIRYSEVNFGSHVSLDIIEVNIKKSLMFSICLGFLTCGDRAVSSWWMQMFWHQIGSRPNVLISADAHKWWYGKHKLNLSGYGGKSRDGHPALMLIICASVFSGDIALCGN